MEAFIQKEKEYLELESWHTRSDRLVAGFTTKNGGVSKGAFSSLNCGLHVHDEIEDVLANRERLAQKLGIPLSHWVAGEQVHDTKVEIVRSEDRGKGAKSVSTAWKGADGLLTKEKDILLIAFYADCIPLYFFDPVHEIAGIAHAGWKGTVGRIGEKMVQAFEKEGSDPDDILVAIGPGISQIHYEVDERVAVNIPDEFHEKVLLPKGNDRFLLDLKKLNKEILLQTGILRHNIVMTKYCTYEDEALFFSHRRDQGKTGRMLGFIGIQGNNKRNNIG